MFGFAFFLNLFIVLVFLAIWAVWSRKNYKFLNPTEIENYALEVSHANKYEHLRLLIISMCLAVWLVSRRYTDSGIPLAVVLGFLALFIAQSVIRDHKVSKRLELPVKFLKREIYLGIYIVFSLVMFAIWALY